jgi:hypothetical protein
MSARLSSLVPALVLAACGSAAAPASRVSAPPVPVTQASADSMIDDCVAAFTRARTCTDAYLPALVDLRVRLDLPAGIAATARDHGTSTLVAQARAEWAHDAEDAPIAAHCRQIADALPPAQQAELRPRVATCVAEADCAGFVRCLMPIEAGLMSARR